MTIYLAVFIQYRDVTDGQTDRRTDRIAISISRVSVLTCDKNCIQFTVKPTRHHGPTVYDATSVDRRTTSPQYVLSSRAV